MVDSGTWAQMNGWDGVTTKSRGWDIDINVTPSRSLICIRVLYCACTFQKYSSGHPKVPDTHPETFGMDRYARLFVGHLGTLILIMSILAPGRRDTL